MTTGSRPPRERKLTLSIPNTASNFESGTTMEFTAPSNSRSIRATSFATTKVFEQGFGGLDVDRRAGEIESDGR